MPDASAVVSPLRPRVLEPGLRALDPGVERYVVRGGGAIAIAIEPGDVLEIVDLEGRQAAELVLFSPAGRADAGAIGARAAHEPTELRRILSEPGEDAQRVRAALERRGLDLGRVRAVRLFGGDSLPGEEARFRAEREAFMLVAAPGGPMPIDRQDPPTDLLVFLRRAVIRRPPGAAMSTNASRTAQKRASAPGGVSWPNSRTARTRPSSSPRRSSAARTRWASSPGALRMRRSPAGSCAARAPIAPASSRPAGENRTSSAG